MLVINHMDIIRILMYGQSSFGISYFFPSAHKGHATFLLLIRTRIFLRALLNLNLQRRHGFGLGSWISSCKSSESSASLNSKQKRQQQLDMVSINNIGTFQTNLWTCWQHESTIRTGRYLCCLVKIKQPRGLNNFIFKNMN